MDINELERGTGNVSMTKYKYVYDKYDNKIYKLHTPKTDGEADSIHTVICPDCKNEMMKGGKYYCPKCEE